jgi:hypothetical protein
MKHDYQKGDLVWWTLGNHKPLLFEDDELFLGIVTAATKKAEGIEVYWLNNGVFKIMNYYNIMRTNFTLA